MHKNRAQTGVRRKIGTAIVMLWLLALSAACTASTPEQQELPQVNYSRDLGASLYDQIDEIARQSDGSFALQTTDQQATSALIYAADQFVDNPLRAAAIRFSPGRVHLYVKLDDLTPMTLNMQATGRVSISDGWPALTLEQASVGSFQLPGYLRSWVARVITETIRDSGIHYRFDVVEITEGRIAVQGRVIP